MAWWRRTKRATAPAAEGSGYSNRAQGGDGAGTASGADIPPPLLMVLNTVQNMDRKPPVTLGLIGLMCILHARGYNAKAWLVLPNWLHSYWQRFGSNANSGFWLCPDKVLANFEVSRVLISPFLHQTDGYLFDSILSFLWKGYHLEDRLGSVEFFLLLVYLIVLSQTLVVVAAHLLSYFFISRGIVHECFVGFSGVLSGLKMVLNYNSPAFTQVYTFRVPTKYASWLELVITYLLVPKLPLIAPACGVLVGYIYVTTPSVQTSIDRTARQVQKLLLHVGIVKQPFHWRGVWSQVADFMRGRKRRWWSRK